MRAANLLAAQNLRVLVLPEASHNKWNDFGRAIDAAGMRLAMLKLSLLVNHGRGPFGSHRFQFQYEEAGNMIVNSKPDEYFLDLLPRLSYDMGFDLETLDDPVSFVKSCWHDSVSARIREVSQLFIPCACMS